MESLLRVLNVIFWVAAPLFVTSLFFSGFAAELFGDRAYRVVNALLVGMIVICSGAIASYEFGRNPIADTERGEWTNRQLFLAIVFTISFFYGQLSAVVEPVAGGLGAAAVVLAKPILPCALAFAAGAMIFVVAEELVPEAKRGSPDVAAMSVMVGFSVMMTLDVALG